MLLLSNETLCGFERKCFNLHLFPLSECQVNKAILVFKETICLKKNNTHTPCRHLPTAQLT